MTVTELREHRLADLHDAAHRRHVEAEALEALVEAIHHAAIPVAHFEPVWRRVEARLRSDAREAHRRSMCALDRIADVQLAIDAGQVTRP